MGVIHLAKVGPKKDPVIRQQIRDLLAEGLTTRQIAFKLDYSTQRIWKLRKEIETEQEQEAQSA